VREFTLDPGEVGLPRNPLEALRGDDAAYNAQVVRDVFAGAVGPVRDAVVLNAGVALALTLADRGEDRVGFIDALKAGMDRARVAIDDGLATSLLQRWVAATRG